MSVGILIALKEHKAKLPMGVLSAAKTKERRKGRCEGFT